MRRSGTDCLALILAIGISFVSGCASEIASTSPTPASELSPEKTTTPPPESPLPTARELPTDVTENTTFATVEGIPHYRLGPGDVVDVLIAKGLAVEKQTLTVKPNGILSLPLMNVQVNGLTPDQAAEAIAQALAGYFRDARVEVQVKEYNSKKVRLFGAVAAGRGGAGGAGIYPLTGRTTLLDLIAKAGGPAPNAVLEKVQVTRTGGQTHTANLFRLISLGDMREDVVLENGDVIYVPERAPGEDRRIFVFGEVKSPGAYGFSAGMSVVQAIAMAGGPTDLAVGSEIRVIRGDLAKPQIIEANFPRVLADADQRQVVALQPYDIVYVPRSAIGNWNSFLAKLRPTLEFLTLPFQSVLTIRAVEK